MSCSNGDWSADCSRTMFNACTVLGIHLRTKKEGPRSTPTISPFNVRTNFGARKIVR